MKLNVNKNDLLITFITAFIVILIILLIAFAILNKKSKDEINNVSLENSNNELLKITSDLKYNPENLILSNENYNTMLNNIIISLSPNEKEIFNLIKENYSYNDISKILNLNIKQVYNSVYRIKDKVKTIIEN